MKDSRLAVRLGEDQLERIRQAAALSGQSVSDFALRTLTAEAANVLADRRLLSVDEAGWVEVMAVLDRPLQHKPKLATLLNDPGPFADA